MVHRQPKALASGLIVFGGLIVLLATFVLSDSAAVWVTLIGVTVTQFSLLPLMSRTEVAIPESVSPETSSREELEDWFAQQAEQLQRESDRLQERQRALTQQFSRVQEFLEYPIADADQLGDPDVQIRLSEKDQAVQELLEAEAERGLRKDPRKRLLK